MKGKLILVTGGCRSGKSAFAEELVASRSERKFYLATSPVLDDETRERVRRHQEARAGRGWETIEEEVDLPAAIARAKQAGGDGLLLECLTLWLNNLFFRRENLTEDEAAAACRELLAALQSVPGTAAVVTNELGFGLVPENALARRFRDASGRCGTLLAAAASEVYLVVCGIPQRIK